MDQSLDIRSYDHSGFFYGVTHEDFEELKKQMRPSYLFENPHVPFSIKYNPKRKVLGIFLKEEKERLIFDECQVPSIQRDNYRSLREVLLERLDRIKAIRESWVD